MLATARPSCNLLICSFVGCYMILLLPSLLQLSKNLRVSVYILHPCVLQVNMRHNFIRNITNSNSSSSSSITTRNLRHRTTSSPASGVHNLPLFAADETSNSRVDMQTHTVRPSAIVNQTHLTSGTTHAECLPCTLSPSISDR